MTYNCTVIFKFLSSRHADRDILLVISIPKMEPRSNGGYGANMETVVGTN